MTVAARLPRTRARDFEANAFHRPRIVQDRIGEWLAADALLARLAKKDLATWQHSKRVGRLAAVMGTELGLPPHIVRELTLAAALHDIGKLTVPTYLLRKTDRLSAAEYALLMQHTVAGEQVLANAMPGHSTLLAVARSHHERADGAGLPDGLARRDIPLAARIVCVADAFDAMITNRPYQRRRSLWDAIEELDRCVGHQFDGPCVAAMTRIVERSSNSIDGESRLQHTVRA